MVGAVARGRRPSSGPFSAIRAVVLGGFEVTVAGRAVTRAAWQRMSAERLVKLLLVTPGHRVAREAVAETLWPDAPPQTSRANLRKAIFFARNALGDALAVDARSVGFDPGRLDLDLDRLREAFETLSHTAGDRSGAGWSGDLDTATEIALELGSRDLLPDDPYEDWLVGPRDRLRSRWQTVALEAARAAQRSGRSAEAHELVDRLLDLDPTDEAAHRLAIELYASEGRHHAARRQLELCRAALREHLDADPSPETEAALRSAVEQSAREMVASPVSRLVARQDELRQIEALLDRVAAGRFAAALLRGPAGIGKSRLLREVASYGRTAGWTVIEWQAVEAARTLAYGPFRIGLAAVMTPEDAALLGEPASSGVAAVVPSFRHAPRLEFAGREALSEALVSAVERLALRRPVVLAFDDLPWLDPPSIEALGIVVSGLPHVPILLAATFRDDEPAGAETAALLDQVRRAGGLELALGPLALRDVEPLILGNLGGESVEPRLARLAHERSGGNPLFCLELLRAGRERGRIRVDGGRWTLASATVPEEVPDSVRRLVAVRTAALGGPARELLDAVAELGGDVSYATLAATLPDVPGGVMAALDAAIDSGLLAERGAGYAFAHPLYRLAVQGTIRPNRRGALHLAAALALAGTGAAASPEELQEAAALSTDPARVAAHALVAQALGVTEATRIAVAFGLEGGEREARLFDLAAAEDLLARALAAWRRLPHDVAVRFGASAALARLGTLRLNAGDEAGGTAACREAVTAARTPEELAAACVTLRYVPYRHGHFETALSILQEGLASLPPDAAAPRARLRTEMGWVLVRLRRVAEAIVALEDAARTLEMLGDRQGAMASLDALGVALRISNRLDESIRRLERSLALALDLGDARGELYARTHLASSLTRAGLPARARPHVTRALELARLMGDRYLESVVSWKAAEMEDALGDRASAVELRRRELELLGTVGGNPHNEALAHAHLAVMLGRSAHPAAGDGEAAAAREEAAAAREAARRSEETGYAERIERVLATGEWGDAGG